MVIDSLKLIKRLLLFITYAPLISNAQSVLTKEANMMRIDDVENKESVDYVEIGKGGKDISWDFSQATPTGQHNIVYTCDSDSIYLERIESNTIYCYHLVNDSLFLKSIENPQLLVKYNKPIFCLRYPVEYNYNHSCDFSGEGKYCGTHFVRQYGTTEVNADGQGTLILSEGDTLMNVMRIHTTTTLCTQINKDSCFNDSENLKHEIVEQYQWYARGYRYPVFESILQTTFHDMTPVASRQLSYRYAPDSQRLNPDPLNENMLVEPIGAGDKQGTYSVFNYAIHNNGNSITIEYDLSEPAHIRILICDIMGFLCRNEDFSASKGSGYSLDIECDSLHRGQYILYINVDGKVYSNKIILQ